MPIYEYKCSDCQNKFESLRSMKDADTLIQCSQCKSANTKRQLSVCYSSGQTHSSSSSNSSCAGCSGGSCSSCGH